MFNYAILNEDRVCVGIMEVNYEISDNNYLLLDSYDEDYLYRKYENGQWSEEKFIPELEPSPPSVEEKLADLEQLIQSQQMQNLILTEELSTLKEQVSLLTDLTGKD